MGNSCFKSYLHKNAKLIDSHGDVITLVKLPATVADIMMENPGFAVALVGEQLMLTGRVAVMKADEVLLGGKVYMVVPVLKANSKMSESELSAVENAVGKGIGRRRGGSAKVWDSVEISREKLEALVRQVNQKCLELAGGPRRRVSQPVLEPIIE